MRVLMQSALASTERAKTALASQNVRAWQEGAAHIGSVLGARETREASHEDSWQGILGQALSASQKLAQEDRRSEARRIFAELEAACWRCHDRYVAASRTVEGPGAKGEAAAWR